MKTTTIFAPYAGKSGTLPNLFRSQESTNENYFCADGLRRVLNVNRFRSAEISSQPFNGSLRVNVKGELFTSKLGSYTACHDHPKLIREWMGYTEKTTPQNFTFYIKIQS